MIDIHAISDFNKDDIVCNDINLNLNGLDVDTIPEPLSSLLQAQGETEDADFGTDTFDNEENRFGYGGKDFSFVYKNNNDNEFIIPRTPPTPLTPPIDLDLALANQLSNTVSIRLGNGNGTFEAAPDVGVGSGLISVAVCNFD